MRRCLHDWCLEQAFYCYWQCRYEITPLSHKGECAYVVKASGAFAVSLSCWLCKLSYLHIRIYAYTLFLATFWFLRMKIFNEYIMSITILDNPQYGSIHLVPSCVSTFHCTQKLELVIISDTKTDTTALWSWFCSAVRAARIVRWGIAAWPWLFFAHLLRFITFRVCYGKIISEFYLYKNIIAYLSSGFSCLLNKYIPMCCLCSNKLCCHRLLSAK